MALTLFFHPLSSYCHKVLIALYENEVAFNGYIVDFADPQARAEFTALWPTAKIPLLRDEQHNRVVPETSIIIEYLEQHYPGGRSLLPADPDARLDARLWDRLFDLYVMSPMQRIVAVHLKANGDSQSIVEATAALQMAYEMIEQHMADRIWAAGEDFSIADCAAAPALFYASIVAPFPEQRVHLAAYFERLLQRPSVRRVLDEARPYFHSFPLKDSIPARFLGDESSAP